MHAGQREACRGMVKLAVGPEDSIVALLARRWESGMRHRSLRVVVIRLVTADARRAGDVVVVVDMAVAALPRRNSMRSRKRETGLRVVKRCRLPR